MGIAIIIPNADFSNSPLGKVTLEKSEEEKVQDIVMAYAAKIGTSAYNTQLTTLVSGLRNIGCWEDLDIYPMLGDSLDKKTVNLNTDGLFGEHLVVSANASNNSNFISFDSSINTGTFDGKKTIMSDSLSKGFYAYLNAIVTSSTQNTSRVYSTLRVAGGNGVMIGTGLSAASFNIKYHSSPGAYSTSNGRERGWFSASVNGNTLYSRSANEETVQEAGETVTKYELTNTLGGATGQTGSAAFTGNIYLWAIGDIDFDKRIQVDALFGEFINAVKPNL